MKRKITARRKPKKKDKKKKKKREAFKRCVSKSNDILSTATEGAQAAEEEQQEGCERLGRGWEEVRLRVRRGQKLLQPKGSQ